MKKFTLKKSYLSFSSFFLVALSMPFVFAKSKPMGNTIVITSLKSNTISQADLRRNNIYDSLKLGSLGLAKEAFDYAMKGLDIMKAVGKVENYNVISIVDFSKASSQKRLYVLDLKNQKVLFNTYVAHGMNSGKEYAENFSNDLSSDKSSLGFYETLGTYNGEHGYSLKLEGIEKGINDNAGIRNIVMHGAQYVGASIVREHGYIGRSWGCPAIPEALQVPIIQKIKNGTCLFIYSPDKNYLSHSEILKQATAPVM
jgi:L,D-transpeptidase catalytic domain